MSLSAVQLAMFQARLSLLASLHVADEKLRKDISSYKYIIYARLVQALCRITG